MLDMRSGEPLLVRARATLLATGGGPTMYLYHTPSGDKSCDGMAMALRAGLPLRDMEMVQFHPTGLLAGPNTRMTGTVLEEGLRGSGGHLIDATGTRFMFDYDKRGERATRDIVCRGIADRIRKGHASPNGGVYIAMGHLGPDNVRREFKGMVERCADCGFDLAQGQVEVIPTAHYMMGGVQFAPDCTTALPRLYAAGEDTGGVHGANRLGGNGVANSTVFGGLAGDSIAGALRGNERLADPDKSAIEAAHERAFAPLGRRHADLETVRRRLYQVMWNDVGILRTADGLARASHELNNLAAAPQPDGRAGRRPALQPDLDGPAQPGKPGAGQPLDLRGGAGAQRQPRRALPRGLPANLGPCVVALHRCARRRRRLPGDQRAGRLHPRAAGRIAVAAGGGVNFDCHARDRRASSNLRYLLKAPPCVI